MPHSATRGQRWLTAPEVFGHAEWYAGQDAFVSNAVSNQPEVSHG